MDGIILAGGTDDRARGWRYRRRGTLIHYIAERLLSLIAGLWVNGADVA